MRNFLSICLLGFILALGGCSADETPDYRYRLTVEVDTPDGLKTGSSVIEVEQSMGRTAMSGGGKRINRRARGEAVAVDLPGGRMLFALLRSDSNTGWASQFMQTLAPKIEGEPWEERFDNMLLLEGEIVLPRTFPKTGPIDERSAYPMLVTFADLDDPTSVARVDPDDLAATFGEGYELRRITVQLTDDPVTGGIEERLAWFQREAESGGVLVPMIRNRAGRYEVAPGYDESLADLGLSSFSTEAYK